MSDPAAPAIVDVSEEVLSLPPATPQRVVGTRRAETALTNRDGELAQHGSTLSARRIGGALQTASAAGDKARPVQGLCRRTADVGSAGTDPGKRAAEGAARAGLYRPPYDAQGVGGLTQADIVNLDGRGMLVVSVARRLGSQVRLLAHCATRFKPSGAAKGALGPLS
jgi:hypothetical protein